MERARLCMYMHRTRRVRLSVHTCLWGLGSTLGCFKTCIHVLYSCFVHAVIKALVFQVCAWPSVDVLLFSNLGIGDTKCNVCVQALRAVCVSARVCCGSEERECHGEELVVDESHVDGEDGHEEDDVTTSECHLHDVAQFLS